MDTRASPSANSRLPQTAPAVTAAAGVTAADSYSRRDYETGHHASNNGSVSGLSETPVRGVEVLSPTHPRSRTPSGGISSRPLSGQVGKFYTLHIFVYSKIDFLLNEAPL